jgi:hypothetical protein
MTTGNQADKTFPVDSLQAFLLPNQVLQLKLFAADSLEDLEEQINDWVRSTHAIVAVPGAITISGGLLRVGLSYVPASEGVSHA